MKCKACHHLNIASEAECFMCGAKLYRGAPKAHGIVFVFLALCIFIPIFSATGGILKVLPYFGVSTSGLKAGGPGLVPIILGVLGVSACLTISRTQLPSQTQGLYCALVAGCCWLAYLVFVVGFAKELQAPPRRAELNPPPSTIVQARGRFDLAPVDPRRAPAVFADARCVAVREAGTVA